MMIAISNIAWDVCEYEEVAALLHRYSVDAIDIVPGKYFPKPDKADESEIARVRDWWAVKGIEITGMQALLFGTSGLNLFAAPEVQTAMLRHLNAVCRIASGMGAKRLVFGSPKNRDRSEFGEAEATEIANDFFHRLGDVAGSHGVVICLEPNPPCYGANFMTDSAETARVVTEVAHPAIRMQLDTGAITINGEDPENVIGRYASLIGHIHASEPDLVPLGDGNTDHARAEASLASRLPTLLVSIEMLATGNEPHLNAIERALQVAVRHYRCDGSAKGVSK